MNELVTIDDLATLDFAKGNGLVTVVAQDAHSGSVLMIAHADREALERTMEVSEMHYRSRTRGLWRKGETSGHTQRVVSLHYDCDRDAVLASVISVGPACHTGARGCFGTGSERSRNNAVLEQLSETIRARAEQADNKGATSYTRRLLTDRNLRLKKLGEESVELAVACADGDRERAVDEAADLIYHTLVALRSLGAGVDDVIAVLEKRMPT